MFKNAMIYRVNQKLPIDLMEEHFPKKAFAPCQGYSSLTCGWVREDDEELFVPGALDVYRMTLKIEKKVVPASALRERVEEKRKRIEQMEDRKLRIKEIREIKEDSLLELLPRALPTSKRIRGLYSPKDELLLIDTSSNAEAERFLNRLRDTIGSLLVAPLTPQHKPQDYFTLWLGKQKWPDGFGIGYSCDLLDIEDRSTVKFRNQDMSSREIQANIEAGKICTKIQLRWGDLAFTVDKDLVLRQLKIGPEEYDYEDKADSGLSHKDAEAHHTVLCLRKIMALLMNAVGGESLRQTEIETDTESLANVKAERYEKAVEFVRQEQQCSISALQRHFKIGYNKAAEIVEEMEREGLVSPMDENGRREIYVTEASET